MGLVGSNGVGKTTFLEVITGSLPPTAGTTDIGETVVFGYYRQAGLEFTPDETVIDVVRRYAEVATLSDGTQVPVTQFLSKFLFPYSTHNTKVEKLSGGERRRLYLVTVLMKNPNFLILDEPTNDLDIISLNVLEEYLAEFRGCLIIVSHDRYFLDKLADHIFVFEGNGVIKDYVGKYSEYREYVRELEREKAPKPVKVAKEEVQTTKKGLTYKEKREVEALETDIESLEKEKSDLEAALSSGILSPKNLTEKSVRIGEVISLIEIKSDRWLELNS